MNRLVANPALRRQIGPKLPWLLWRDHPERAGRQGLVCIVLRCLEPACECGSVVIHGYLIDDRTAAVTWDGKGLDFEFWEKRDTVAEAIGESVVLHFDRATGQLAPDRESTPTAADVVSWLAQKLDEEFRSLVGALQPDAVPSQSPKLWIGWKPGGLVSHPKAFPHFQWPPLRALGKTWYVEDHHCVEPRCECKEAVISFHEVSERAGQPAPRFVGNLALTLPDLGVKADSVEACAPSRTGDVLALWVSFREQHRDLGQALLARRARMKTLRPPRRTEAEPATLRTARRIGRNDPCPCGSGKKAKKCCRGEL